MQDRSIEREIQLQVDKLPPDQQKAVLEYARGLAAGSLRGTPGSSLLRFAGTINADDLAVMSQQIEEHCESV